MTIRILIADDHPVVRDGLVAVLATQPDFIVVGEAGTGREAVDRALELLIGVADGGNILGTGADKFDNDDKYLLHVNNRIREYIGLEFANHINFQLVPVEGQYILLVQCQPSPSPVFLKSGKDEDFYVRIGPGNRRLSTSEVLTYVANRKTKP